MCAQCGMLHIFRHVSCLFFFPFMMIRISSVAHILICNHLAGSICGGFVFPKCQRHTHFSKKWHKRILQAHCTPKPARRSYVAESIVNYFLFHVVTFLSFFQFHFTTTRTADTRRFEPMALVYCRRIRFLTGCSLYTGQLV